MRLRQLRGCYLLAWGLMLLLLGLLYRFTNVFDVVFYFISLGAIKLPLTLHCNPGRLGNQMCAYATLYGLSILNRRPFVALDCNTYYLKDIFLGPRKARSVPDFLFIKLQDWNLLPYIQPGDLAIPPRSNFLNGYEYPCSYTFFDHVRNHIRREFQFDDPVQKHAQDVLHKANVHHSQNVTYVSVHVRRGDYQKRWLDIYEGVPVNIEYFEKALLYFRNKYKNVIFIAVSDDRRWCIKELSSRFGVHVPEKAPSPAHDLAVLANCNHSVLSYGTFGFWGAYLAGGEVLYFNKFLKPNTNFSSKNFLFEKMYPSRWKGIVTVNASIWSKTPDAIVNEIH